MHSKSDNLGYLKDQNKVKFPGGFAPWTPTLDPQGMAQSPAPTPPPPPQNPPALRCLLRLLLRIYFFPDSRFACGGMSAFSQHKKKESNVQVLDKV